MVNLSLIFKQLDLKTTVELIMTLPASLQPTFFSSGENVSNKKNTTLDQKRFEEFIEKNSQGFFLHSDFYSLNISPRKKGFSSLDVYLKEKSKENLILDFVYLFASLAPIFGYACERDERYHRNRIYKKIGMNYIETWVGRDLSKYIPGIYWYTLFSQELLDDKGVKLTDLESVCLTFTPLPNNKDIFLLQCYEKAIEWEEYADRIDKFCLKIPGIFSIKHVSIATSEIDNYLEYSNVLKNWK